MNTDKSFSLKSIIPVWYEYIYLLLIGGVSSGVFVWLFLWILDGNEWKILGINFFSYFIILVNLSHISISKQSLNVSANLISLLI